ncbi:GlsB/YeaQ/YmgE family stress response membrane protein [Lutibacter holmesii]|uniref:GlsB/YeaQ/YmgE family stress response membrane protein n=1 Tax=Lutibacter holmesii TaxID=1137985 RepID=A0ABW3WKK2_9FLAO
MIYSIIIGGFAGWLAGNIMKGGGYGILKNILLGIIGGLVGGWVFNFLGVIILNGFLGDLLEGVIGAVIILAIAGAVKKK